MTWNPLKAVKERAVVAFLARVIRHALTAGGVGGVFSDSDISQAAGALAILVGIAWSHFSDSIAERKAKATTP